MDLYKPAQSQSTEQMSMVDKYRAFRMLRCIFHQGIKNATRNQFSVRPTQSNKGFFPKEASKQHPSDFEPPVATLKLKAQKSYARAEFNPYGTGEQHPWAELFCCK